MPGPGRGRKSESKQEIGLVLSLKPHYMQILRHAESTLEPAIGTNDSTRHINGGERKRDRTERRARPMFEKRARDELVERDARQGVAALLDIGQPLLTLTIRVKRPSLCGILSRRLFELEGRPHRATFLDAYPSQGAALSLDAYPSKRQTLS